MDSGKADWLSVGYATGRIGLILATLGAGLAGGCAPGSGTRLPETGALARPLLSAEEQKKAIAELEARKRELEKQAAVRPAQAK